MAATPRPLGRAWPAALLLVATYAAVEAPLRAVLAYPLEGSLLAMDWVVTVMFALDLVLRRLRSASAEADYRGASSVELGLDLLALVPSVLALPFARALPGDLSALVLLRMAKLVRMWRDGRVLSRTDLIHPSALRLIRFGLWSALLTHWIACGWMWLRLPDGFSGRATPYVESVYWAVTTVATVGYGDITPADAAEMMYAMVVMLVGVGVYGFIIGNLAGLLLNRDASRAAFQRKMDDVRGFMLEHDLPTSMRRRIEAHYVHLWQQRRTQGSMRAVADLPEALRAEVALHLSRPILAKVPFLHDASEELLRELAVSLRPILIAPGEWVFQGGTIGRDMFLIDRGAVDIVDSDGSILNELGEGDFFGEIALLRGGRRGAGARATAACQLYALDKLAFDAVLEGHPELASHIRAVAGQRGFDDSAGHSQSGAAASQPSGGIS